MFATRIRIKIGFSWKKIRFKDENGCTRFNLYYAPLSLPQENIISVETRDEILDRILGYAIIHPNGNKRHEI